MKALLGHLGPRPSLALHSALPQWALVSTIAVLSISALHAELFSSSTNFINTLTIRTNEAILVQSLRRSESYSSFVSILSGGTLQQVRLPDVPDYYRRFPSGALGIAGPAQVQFPDVTIFMEFHRIQTTNLFNVFLGASNSITLTVPPGKTVNFPFIYSWRSDAFGSGRDPSAAVTLSNSVAALRGTLYQGDSFTGPLQLTIQTAIPSAPEPCGAFLVYYFTEEFAAAQGLPAIRVPAGQTQISIEKSVDLKNWSTVFFKTASDTEAALYRFNISK